MTTNHHTPFASAVAAFWEDFNTIFSDLDAGITGLQTGVEAINQLRFGEASQLTIASGAIIVTQTSHTLQTEGATAADDLVTITGGDTEDLLLLKCVNASNVVTVKHGTGNIYLAGGVDITLNDVRKVLPLLYDGTKWIEVGAGYWTQVLNVGTLGALTIASDAVTVTKSRHVLDTEGGAASDNLSTINGGRDGAVLVISSTAAARVITVKSHAGNIIFDNGLDFVLDSPNTQLSFIFNGSNWIQLSSNSAFIMKHIMSTSYARVHSLLVPASTLRALTGTNTGYELLVAPSDEVRNHLRIKASNATFLSGDTDLTIEADDQENDNANNGHYAKILTTASTDNVAYLRTTQANVVRRKWNPTLVMVLKPDAAVNNRRIWAGMFEDIIGSVDTLALAGIGFRYSTGASDTTWKGVCCDGATQTVVNTGVTVSPSTKYVLKIRVDSDNNTAYFSVNNSTEVTIATNLPAETTDLGLVAELITLNNVARGLSISRIYLEHD